MGMLQFHEAATSASSPILGPSRLSARQMADYLKKIRARPNITVPTRVLAQLYLDEGAKVGVRGDVAFAQSILETGGFTIPAAAPTTTTLPASGGATRASTASTFPTRRPECGRRYSSSGSTSIPTSRTALKDKILLPGTLKLGFRGKVQTWWDLWGTWATGALYGQRVYDIYERMVEFAKTDPIRSRRRRSRRRDPDPRRGPSRSSVVVACRVWPTGTTSIATSSTSSAANHGNVEGVFVGVPLLLLSTTGARSGAAPYEPRRLHD